MDVPPSLKAIIDSQEGVTTRQQLLRAGVSPAQIRHAIRARGPWQRVVNGVYATFTGALTHTQTVRAALLYAGEGSVVTGSWACRAYDMRYMPRSGLRILISHGSKRAPIPIADIQRTRRWPEIRKVRGFPCAEPARATLDAVAESRDLRTVRAALCEVVQRRLVDPDSLVASYESAGMHSALVTRVLSDLRSGCRSEPECELRDLMRTSSVLPEFIWNQALPDVEDVVPDAYEVRSGLVLEVDSVEWHQLGDGPERTERKRARYVAGGWRPLPIVPRRLRDEPATLLAEIESAYLAGLHGTVRRRLH